MKKAFLVLAGLTFSTLALAQPKVICGKASTEYPSYGDLGVPEYHDGKSAEVRHPDLFTRRKTEAQVFEAAKADLNSQLAQEKNISFIGPIFETHLNDDYTKPYQADDTGSTVQMIKKTTELCLAVND